MESLAPQLPDKLLCHPIGCSVMETVSGHAFISYVREDSQHADRLQRILTRRGSQYGGILLTYGLARTGAR